jgi:hypothetical protein
VYPTRTIFNYVIAATTLDGKTVLLDATDKNAALGILPLRDLNCTGRLIKPDVPLHKSTWFQKPLQRKPPI